MMKGIFKNRCNIYTMLWCVYYLQGSLYPVGTAFTKIILLVLIVWGFWDMLVVSRYYPTPKYINYLNFFIAFISFYVLLRVVGITGSDITKVNEWRFAKNFYISILPIYVYYNYSIRGCVNEKWMGWWVILFLFTFFLSYYGNQEAKVQSTGHDEIINNVSYMFVALLPIITVFNRRYLYQFILLSICGIPILTSTKRGAILIYGIVLVLYVVFGLRFSNISFLKKMGFLVVVGILFLIGYNYAIYLMDNSILFHNRMMKTMDGDFSGREDIYTYIISYFFEKEHIFNMLFGNGLDGTLAIVKNGAHNDWLQLLIDTGLVGVVAYFIYWLVFVKHITLSYKEEGLWFPLLIVFVIEVSRSLFSFSFYNMFFPTTLVIGYCMARTEMGTDVYKRWYYENFVLFRRG